MHLFLPLSFLIYCPKFSSNSLMVNIISLLMLCFFFTLAFLKFLRFEVNKPSKILIKTSSTMEYIESNIQITKEPRKNDPLITIYEKTYLQGSLEGVLEVIQVSSLSLYPPIPRWLDLLFKALHQERKRRKETIPISLKWAP